MGWRYKVSWMVEGEGKRGKVTVQSPLLTKLAF